MKKSVPKNWVDFRHIKSVVTMEMVLKHYGVFDDLKPSGKNLVGCCPIHHGTNPRQFTVNLEGNKFNCFGNCQGGGNVLDFVAKMEGGLSVREAALKLKEWFLDDDAPLPTDASGDSSTQLVRKKDHRVREKETSEADVSEAAILPANIPLTFELKQLDSTHPWFQEREFAAETATHFGLGFCNRGMMKDRIVIPIHNKEGQLVAYCGRAITQEQEEQGEKYKLPPKFRKSVELYNLHRVLALKEMSTLIVVESFLSVWRLFEFGIEHVVTTLGSSLSECQADLLFEAVGPHGKVLMMYDADEAGQAGMLHAAEMLVSKVFVKTLDISPFGQKPHHLQQEDVHQLLFTDKGG